MIQDIFRFIPWILLIVILVILLIWNLRLRRNLRRMTQELKKSREETYNRFLQIDLSDKASEDLAAEINNNLEYQKQLKLRADAKEKQLEQSVADIAHDLRTPLTVIKGNLQMLSKEELSVEGRSYLEISETRAEALKNMVDTFFELSVLESHDQPIATKPLELVTFLSACIIDHETLIRSHNLTPNLDFPEHPVRILADEESLYRVFGNLLGNIIKYANDEFSVSIAMEVLGETDHEKSGDAKGASRCLIRLSNPIAEGTFINIDHIFQRSYRADPSRTDGSAGLGLYIAKLLTERQGGTIEAELADGRLYFILTFPCA